MQIHDPSEIPNQWKLYAGGAKQIGEIIYTVNQTCVGDAKIILSWLFYVDTLFEFTSRHWRQKVQTCGGEDQIRQVALLSGDRTEVGSSFNRVQSEG